MSEAKSSNSLLHATLLTAPIHATCPCLECGCCCFHFGKCVGGCDDNGHVSGDEEDEDEW